MTISAIEGVVQNGQIRLLDNVTLPENARVYVIIPSLATVPNARIYSPRLVHQEQAGDFVKQVIEASTDAKL